MITRRNLAITFLLLLVQILNAETVCKIAYTGQPEDLNGKNIQVPEGVVALSEEVHVGIPDWLVAGGVDANPSIMFVLDHSPSMWIEGNSWEMDMEANRFKVTSDLIDSIYARNPQAEVGLSIFSGELYLDKDDDSLIQTVNARDGYGYLPLLTLDQQYNSQLAGNKSGRDVLKHYLQTRDTVDRNDWAWTTLDYKSGADEGTNINSGFNGAKAAFANAANGKGRQYIIFISDGDNQSGGNGFEDGIDVPSTFTIFFAKSDDGSPLTTDDVPASIKNMTENINANDYFPNKETSQFWPYENTNKESLMGFIMENIISVIEQSISADVKQISINGTSNSNSWNGSSIGFSEMFPLTGTVSDFTYDISYYVEDTVTIDNSVEVTIVDTATTTQFSVTVDANAVLPDSFSSLCWNRDLAFLDNGTATSALSVTSNSSIRFTESAGDDGYFYNYSDVKITLVSKVKGDTLRLSLSRNGSEHRSDFSIDYENGVNLTDGTLQVEMSDTIVAYFANPKLPLDTLSTQAIFDVGTLLSLESVTYYDRNADGFVDSIYAGFRGEQNLMEQETNDIMAFLTFPDERRFVLDRWGWENSGLAIAVTETGSSDPYTAIRSSDTIVLREGVLSSGGLIYGATVIATDSMAPVILHDGVVLNDMPGTNDDRLTVTFSEAILNENRSGDYFTFRRGADSYRVSLLPESIQGAVAQFQIQSVSGDFIAAGDSVRIHPTNDLVKDLSGLTQQNPQNVEREVRVVSTLNVNSPVFYDATGDGLVDSITLSVSAGEGVVLDANEFRTRVVLPRDRNLSIDTAWFEGTNFILRVTEMNSTPNTAISAGDTVQILAGTIGGAELPQNVTLTAVDSMAPVIAADAVLRDLAGGEVDTLTVTFSEPIESITQSNRIFKFYRETTGYDSYLSQSAVSGTTVSFEINSLSGVTSVQSGDSLNVNDLIGLVRDGAGNVQNISGNVKREIQVITSLTIAEAIYFDRSGDGFIDEITVSIAAGEGAVLDADLIASRLTLPSQRSLQTNSASLTGNLLTLAVTETALIPNTAVMPTEQITLRSGMIGNAEVSSDISIGIVDSMAPVLLDSSAILYDYSDVEDTLVVRFSESVAENSRSGRYFSFRSGATPYDVIMAPSAEGTSVSGRYPIQLAAQVMKTGDMLRVNASQRFVMDTNLIVQDNEENREVPLTVIAAVTVGTASYYDTDADGYVDSLVIGMAIGEGAEVTAEELLTLVHLPDYRNFSITSAAFTGSELQVHVKENRPGAPNTAVTNSDSIIVEKGMVAGAMVPETRVIGVEDHMAPVILENGALLSDYYDAAEDSLTVLFSEPLAPIGSAGEIFAIRRGSEVYHLFLTVGEEAEDEIVFAVNSTTPVEYATSGDSLKIDALRGLIADLEGNRQDNSSNIERRLQVRAVVEPTQAIYYDATGDGLIDEIAIALEAGISLYDQSPALLADLFTLAEDRLLEIDSSAYGVDKLILYVTEGTEYPMTAVSESDTVSIAATRESSIEIKENKQFIAIDSLAPVIVPEGAVLHDSLMGTDLLEVTLSENVTVKNGSPFLFVDGISPYTMTLSLLQVDSTTLLFEVVESDRPEDAYGTDSIWINTSLVWVSDSNGLSQSNPENIRRELTVKKHVNPFNIEIGAVTPYLHELTTVPAELNDPSFELSKGTKGGYTGMIMQARAVLAGSNVTLQGIQLEGVVTIIDVVGNAVIEDARMVYNEATESLIFVWNAKNSYGRPVGNGAYASEIRVRAYTIDGSYSQEFAKRLTLGVKGEVAGDL